MDVVVDKRTELIGIVLALSQGNEYIEEHFSFNIKDEYRNRAFEYFSKFKKHKCIELAREISKDDEGFSYDNPIRLAFSLNDDLQFSGIIEEYLLSELENENLIKEFLIALDNFARESRFVDFYNKNKYYYSSKIQELGNLFNTKKFVFELEKFLKRDVTESFIINIIPMLINANHGFEIEGICIANIGLLSEDLKTIEQFNNGYNHLIVHEICHCFVNCNTRKNKLYISEKLKERLKKQGYGNSISYLNDTIVRAMTIRLREKIENVDIRRFFDRENNFGFIYVKDVYQEIIKYENQDSPWEEYFPNFLSCLLNDAEKQKKL